MFAMGGTPFSATNSVPSRPSMMMLISELRGWIWGVLKPQGPRKPTVMATPVPMRAGKTLRSALTVKPPLPVVLASVFAGGFWKSYKKSAGERRAMRSTAVGASSSCWIRLRPEEEEPFPGGL